MTSCPVSQARNAGQFIAVAQIGAGPPQEVQPRLLAKFGPAETKRVVGNLRQANRPWASLALESYWSRGAVLRGDADPFRFRLSPLSSTAPGPLIGRPRPPGAGLRRPAVQRTGPIRAERPEIRQRAADPDRRRGSGVEGERLTLDPRGHADNPCPGPARPRRPVRSGPRRRRRVQPLARPGRVPPLGNLNGPATRSTLPAPAPGRPMWTSQPKRQAPASRSTRPALLNRPGET
jgi:hypothetical protein